MAVAALRRLREIGISLKGLLLVYHALFIPVLAYCDTIWDGGFDYVTRRAAIIQNDALRAIWGMRRCESVATLYQNYELLNIDEICWVDIQWHSSHSNAPRAGSRSWWTSVFRYEQTPDGPPAARPPSVDPSHVENSVARS